MAKEFKTIEEANKAYTELSAKHDAEVAAHKATKEDLKKSDSDHKAVKAKLEKSVTEHEATKVELKNAQEIAKDAIDKANEAIEQSDPNVYANVNGTKYRINFGVDGLSKEELREDKAKLGKLVKIGSGALTAVK